MKIENQMNYGTYSCCNFVKPPNSVGIVPIRDWEERFLFFFFSINIVKKIPNLFTLRKNEGKKVLYNWMIVFGFELSQTTPLWPHKSFITFQFKFPFDVNEL